MFFFTNLFGGLRLARLTVTISFDGELQPAQDSFTVEGTDMFEAGVNMPCKNIMLGLMCVGISIPAGLQGARLSTSDAHFMKMAAESNMTEAHIGQMAETQGSQQGVKDFGKELVKDHTDSYETLTGLAAKTGESIPKAIGNERTIKQLSHLKGHSFDRAFVHDEVRAHETALAAFKKEAEHGENPEVKAWAKNMIPILEKHLQAAEDLAKQEK